MRAATSLRWAASPARLATRIATQGDRDDDDHEERRHQDLHEREAAAGAPKSARFGMAR
jgi:hypothetical protein